jgi:Phospholipid-translocating P-type ATPase C-terminal
VIVLGQSRACISTSVTTIAWLLVLAALARCYRISVCTRDTYTLLHRTHHCLNCTCNNSNRALVYTSLPIILFGVYDMDVLPDTCLRYPWLYRTGLSDNFLRPATFWGWILQGVGEGIWCTLVVVYGLSGDRAEGGAPPSVLQLGNAAFAIITVAVNMKMLFIQKRWHWVEVALIIVSTALLWGFGVGINRVAFFLTFDWDFYGTQDRQNASANYWLVIILGAAGVFVRDLAWRGYHRWWQPKLHHILQEMEKGGLADIELPPSL